MATISISQVRAVSLEKYQNARPLLTYLLQKRKRNYTFLDLTSHAPPFISLFFVKLSAMSPMPPALYVLFVPL